MTRFAQVWWKRAYAHFQTVKRTYFIFYLKRMFNLVLFSRHDPWNSRILSWGHLLSISNGSLQATEGKVAAPRSYFSVVLTSITTAFSSSPFPGSYWEWASQQWKPEQHCWWAALQSGCSTSSSSSWPNPVGPNNVVTTFLHVLILPNLSSLWPKTSFNWYLLLSVQVVSPLVL